MPRLIQLDKAHAVTLLELPKPAIFHAPAVHVDRIDAVQRHLLRAVGVDDRAAFLKFNLTPLKLRKDIAILGVLHRCAHGNAHPDMCALFPLAERASSACHKELYCSRGARASAAGCHPPERCGARARTAASLCFWDGACLELFACCHGPCCQC